MLNEMKVPAMKEMPVRRRTSRKLLFLLFFFFATVLVILFFQSTFSKVTRIEIVGNELVEEDAIAQAARIRNGDNFFLLPSAKAEARVKSLQAIQSVNVRKTFPGLVRIEIKEYPRVAFQIGADGKLAAVLADSTAVATEGRSIPMDKPILTNWKDGDPLKARLCEALAAIPDPYMSDISEIMPDPSSAWDDKIKMYTRSQFEVVTRISLLAQKMPSLGDMIKSSKEQSVNAGTITMLEQDRVMPFQDDSKQQDSKSSDKDVKKR